MMMATVTMAISGTPPMNEEAPMLNFNSSCDCKDLTPVQFWKRLATQLPNLSAVARSVFLATRNNKVITTMVISPLDDPT